MDIVRNFIQVSGITPADELPLKIRGQILQHTDVETIYIPKSAPPASSIFQIMVKAKITSSRKIDTPLGTIIVIDGVKEFKIIYSSEDASGKANIAAVKVPYNTFIELQDRNTVVENMNINVVDAYFELLDSRRIYSHILYLVDVVYGEGSEKKTIVKVDYESDGNVVIVDDEDNLLSRDFRNMSEELTLSFDSGDGKQASISTAGEEYSVDPDEGIIDIDAEYL